MAPADELAAPGALPVISVAGDPRAMGTAQGRACMDAIRSAVRDAGLSRPGRFVGSLLPFAAGRVLGEGMPREIVRHYPHLSERIQGIARGSGQSVESLMELFVRAARGKLDSPLADPAPAALRRRGDALLCRPVAPGGWWVRRSRPEVGFPSVELTLPWLATAIAGVNERGVAALIAPVAAGGGAREPAVSLLVQECLQRFHDLPGCVDWCRKRPFSGRAALLLADASGEAAVVSLADGARQVVPVGDGEVVTAGGCEDRHESLRKSLGEDVDEDALAPEIGTRVLVAPSSRTLRVWTGVDGPPATFSAT